MKKKSRFKKMESKFKSSNYQKVVWFFLFIDMIYYLYCIVSYWLLNILYSLVKFEINYQTWNITTNIIMLIKFNLLITFTDTGKPSMWKEEIDVEKKKKKWNLEFWTLDLLLLKKKNILIWAREEVWKFSFCKKKFKEQFAEQDLFLLQ